MHRTATLSIVTALLAAALLAGCGQTGSLYLPDRTAEPISTPDTTPDSAPADRSEDTHRKIH
jgi:predicted small lipoprotein YifL